jgi:hypothetical protein
MSESSNESQSQPGISDDQLPEDLQPTDDNPLAKNPGEEDDADAGAPTSERLEGMPDAGMPGGATPGT